jgi:UDP-N-acetylglucosamine:LPS N-acetylglucosamine transferase
MAASPVRRILLVASPGGHLLQLLALEPAWRGLERTWVTFASVDVPDQLDGESVVIARGPTSRHLPNFARNFVVAWRTVRAHDPDVILSTGAALAVPFFIVGKLHGCRLVFVESLSHVSGLGLTGRLVYPLADAFFVQWPQAARHRRTRFAGSLL